MSKVVHLSNEAHAVAKVFCKENGLKMSDWVASLITRAIVVDAPAEPEVISAPPPVIQTVAVVEEEVPTGPKKKKLLRLDEDAAEDDVMPAYSQPPFWVRTVPVMREEISGDLEISEDLEISGDLEVSGDLEAEPGAQEQSVKTGFGGMSSENLGLSVNGGFSPSEG